MKTTHKLYFLQVKTWFAYRRIFWRNKRETYLSNSAPEVVDECDIAALEDIIATINQEIGVVFPLQVGDVADPFRFCTYRYSSLPRLNKRRVRKGLGYT